MILPTQNNQIQAPIIPRDREFDIPSLDKDVLGIILSYISKTEGDNLFSQLNRQTWEAYRLQWENERLSHSSFLFIREYLNLLFIVTSFDLNSAFEFGNQIHELHLQAIKEPCQNAIKAIMESTQKGMESTQKLSMDRISFYNSALDNYKYKIIDKLKAINFQGDLSALTEVPSHFANLPILFQLYKDKADNFLGAVDEALLLGELNFVIEVTKNETNVSKREKGAAKIIDHLLWQGKLEEAVKLSESLTESTDLAISRITTIAPHMIVEAKKIAKGIDCFKDININPPPVAPPRQQDPQKNANINPLEGTSIPEVQANAPKVQLLEVNPKREISQIIEQVPEKKAEVKVKESVIEAAQTAVKVEKRNLFQWLIFKIKICVAAIFAAIVNVLRAAYNVSAGLLWRITSPVANMFRVRV